MILGSREQRDQKLRLPQGSLPFRMSTRSSEKSVRSNPGSLRNLLRIASVPVALVAFAYAFLAGLHTLQDFDLGWQLATGRWVVQHHQIFSADVFSYTAAGQPWIYPVLSGIVFYLAYQAGGYALLSTLGALACAGTVVLLLRRNSFITCILALVAVPLIANRTQPRAEMFSTVLFAAFLSLLWRHYRGGSLRLWLLPVLMALWVNLHLGFVAGLAICGGYALVEALDLTVSARREAVRARLKAAWPWLVATGLATLINPWGPKIYLALARQQSTQGLHTAWIVEWENVRPSWASLRQALEWRDPQSSFWWLIAIALVSAGVATWRKQWGAAILLIVFAYFALQHVRLQALFACVAVVLGGAQLDGWLNDRVIDRANDPVIDRVTDERSRKTGATARLAVVSGLLLAITVIVIAFSLAFIRSADLVSNRYYLRSGQRALFGTGLSWWFPERATEFLLREKLPANVFNGYNLGGYLTWRLFPAYRDYIDGRAIPFGPELFFRAYDLSTRPPDSAIWQQEADARGINTILVPLGRYEGMTLFPQLQAFCHSQLWRPVYLDKVSAIFVRRSAQTADLINRLQVDCATAKLATETSAGVAPNFRLSYRGQAERFNSLANAGGVLYSLERYPEALAALDRAEAVVNENGGANANLHFLRALVLQQTGRADEAETEFLTSLRLEPNDETWFDLGLFYMTRQRYADAAEIFRKSAKASSRPHEMWMMLGQADLQLHQPEPALAAFDRAEDSSPFGGAGETFGASFNSLIATGRAKASYQLGDLPQAVSYQEEAVKLAPADAKLWLGLADLYDAQGRTTKAAEARNHATGK